MTEWTKPKGKIPSHVWYLSLVILWILVTLALAIWWIIHGLNQLKVLSELEPQLAIRLASQHRMILSEGLTLVALLIVGGISFFVLILREARRNEQMKAFFATFTHELKTPLASLRLQAEVLQEDLEGHHLVDRLLQDASRLELQLDNALFLATARISDQIHLEPIPISSVLDRLRSSFPDFDLRLDRDAILMADRRALESVVKNLVQNARVHGKATRMDVMTKSVEDRVELRFVDNGTGFQGQIDAVGKLFYRHTSQSGSGVGLHLCRILVSRMNGDLRVKADEGRGFSVEVKIPEARVS